MIKAIIFDLDGVLIDSEPYYQNILLTHLKRFGVSVTPQDLLAIAGGTTKHYNQVITPLLKQVSIENNVFEDFNNNYYLTHKTPYHKLINPHVIETLEWLKLRGYRIAIASSSKINEIQDFLSACQLTDYFELIMSGEMFNESKPNPEIYQTCVQKLNLSVTECIAVEDSEYGITAAKAAQLTCIAKIDKRFGYNQDFADYFIQDLFELTHILENMVIL